MNRFPPGYLVLVSLCCVILIDVGISSLTGISPAFRLGLIRLLQAGCMAGLLLLSPRGPACLGLTGQPLYQGIRTGLIWSAFMGAGTLLFACLILLAGENPFFLLGPVSFSWHPAVFFAIACVLSPIAEEFFFRGFLYTYMRRFMPVVAAALVSSVLFAACHPSMSSLHLIPFLGGLVFAAAFEYSKSLAAPLIIHILGNTALMLVQYGAN